MSTSVRRESGTGTSDLQITHQPTDRDDDEREATELGPVQHGQSATVVTIGGTSTSRICGVKLPIPSGLRRWWKHYVQLELPHATCRDHLGMYTKFRVDLMMVHTHNFYENRTRKLTLN